jgi:hypothetical protein
MHLQLILTGTCSYRYSFYPTAIRFPLSVGCIQAVIATCKVTVGRHPRGSRCNRWIYHHIPLIGLPEEKMRIQCSSTSAIHTFQESVMTCPVLLPALGRLALTVQSATVRVLEKLKLNFVRWTGGFQTYAILGLQGGRISLDDTNFKAIWQQCH